MTSYGFRQRGCANISITPSLTNASTRTLFLRRASRESSSQVEVRATTCTPDFAEDSPGCRRHTCSTSRFLPLEAMGIVVDCNLFYHYQLAKCGLEIAFGILSMWIVENVNTARRKYAQSVTIRMNRSHPVLGDRLNLFGFRALNSSDG